MKRENGILTYCEKCGMTFLIWWKVWNDILTYGENPFSFLRCFLFPFRLYLTLSAFFVAVFPLSNCIYSNPFSFLCCCLSPFKLTLSDCIYSNPFSFFVLLSVPFQIVFIETLSAFCASHCIAINGIGFCAGWQHYQCCWCGLKCHCFISPVDTFEHTSTW